MFDKQMPVASIRDNSISRLREHEPLIHCITNPISINQCANAVLAVGARPIMAEHPMEVKEITSTAAALMLNTGNITDVRMESMAISAAEASRLGIPFMIDAVGVACSTLRRDFVTRLIVETAPKLIKGNYSEINALYNAAYRSSGVDADAALTAEYMDRLMPELARRTGAVILASGAVDIVTDGYKIYHLNNGTKALSSITGTGCMLGALCASYMSVLPAIEAAATACAVLGISGELAEGKCTEYGKCTEDGKCTGGSKGFGSGSFQVALMDELSVFDDECLKANISMEEFDIE